mmetsp:Transcript_20041/g.22705  ORF Transcript_20041/g.22705 Transcript_20041/m.22705 type:complete len:236 (+) Transcript_20041:157-864(+)
MELIGKQTIDIIRNIAGDEELYQFVSSVPIPPELFCTKWIRLMFSREVKGLNNVMILWDSFFELISSSSSPSSSSSSTSTTALTAIASSSPPSTSLSELTNNDLKGDDEKSMKFIHILEITAASMIILIRDELIPPSPSPSLLSTPQNPLMNSSLPIPLHNNNNNNHHDDEDDRDPNESVHLLMNYSPIDDSNKLIQVVENVMSGKLKEERKKINNNNNNNKHQLVLLLSLLIVL